MSTTESHRYTVSALHAGAAIRKALNQYEMRHSGTDIIGARVVEQFGEVDDPHQEKDYRVEVEYESEDI